MVDMNILACYIRSIFQNFERSLRTEGDLVEVDFKLVLDKYNSSFSTHELEPSICTFRYLSDSLSSFLQPEYPGPSNVVDIEFDDITTKTKLVVRSGTIAIRFDEKSFFSNILDFNPNWDYKHYHEYISQKIINLSTSNKIHLKCDIFDSFVVNGVRQPLLYCFVLDKSTGYKVFSESETIYYKKNEISLF